VKTDIGDETRHYRWDDQRVKLSGVVFAERGVEQMDDTGSDEFDRDEFEAALRKVSRKTVADE
jgi:hypothetical protein